jgi:hypothetical protein
MLEPTPGIVLELVEGGSLFQIIHGRRDESFQAYQLRLPWPVRFSQCHGHGDGHGRSAVQEPEGIFFRPNLAEVRRLLVLRTPNPHFRRCA